MRGFDQLALMYTYHIAVHYIDVQNLFYWITKRRDIDSVYVTLTVLNSIQPRRLLISIMKGVGSDSYDYLAVSYIKTYYIPISVAKF